jgi:von Willebrand factor type A domain
MTHAFVRTLLPMATLALMAGFAPAAPVPAPVKKPQVEVVFCLDTTGSMGGLIDGAKKKIWDICNQIASGKPTPDLKVGLVAYRDRGDDYITKIFDLTSDLDSIHTELKKFSANGGGDEPESVNQALDDAVNKIKWSEDKKTLRIIFLVGDAPPHMDYKDDVKYPVTCKKAAEKSIIINAIQCGTSAECTKVWKDIAVKAEGSYAAIPQEGGVVAIATPFDAKLVELNTAVAKTAIFYGNEKEQANGLKTNAVTQELKGEAAASRAGYYAKNAQCQAGDLLDCVKQGKVKLEDIKKEELPPELQKLPNNKERQAYLDNLEKKRGEIQKEVIELDKKRNDYIAKKRAEDAKSGKNAFDSQVLEMLRGQAKKADIAY